MTPDKAKWTCDECGTVNRLDMAVVELCVETWQSCSNCGEQYAFNLRGKP